MVTITTGTKQNPATAQISATAISWSVTAPSPLPAGSYALNSPCAENPIT